MQRMKRLLCLVTGLFVFQSVHAVIVRGEIWRKKKEDESFYYIYAMYDAHLTNIGSDEQMHKALNFNKLFDLADNQYKILVQNLKQLSQKKVAVLVEDSYSYADGTPFLPSGFLKVISQLQSAGMGTRVDVLQEIANRFKKDGIECINIDHRQKQTAAFTYSQLVGCIANIKSLLSLSSTIMEMIVLNPAFQELKQTELALSSLLKYEPRMNFKMQVILDEFEKTVDTIKSYSDGPILSDYYAKQIKRIRLQSKESYLLMQKAKEQKYTTFIDNLSSTKALRFGSCFNTYGGMLVEMDALHEIYQGMNAKEKVFLIAGGGHVYNTVNVLQQLGYERVYETGATMSQLKPTADSLETLYDIDSILSMPNAEYLKVMSDLGAKTVNIILQLLQKRMVFNPKFFDLMLSDNPEVGWALGHGPIQ